MTTATSATVPKNIADLTGLDRSSLLNLILEQNKKIHDLERLVEDQKRLRLQDSSQVEEKAAKIKEWVTNKLKELENQNKQLRDQNRKQKEVVESLSIKLASISPISTSPRKRNQAAGNGGNINITCNYNSLDKVQYIDRTMPSSPINTIDVNQSLKTRRPQLKKLQQHQPANGSFGGENQNMSSHENVTNSSSSPYHCFQQRQDQQQQENHHYSNSSSAKNGVSLISIGDTATIERIRQRRDSPLYDCVNLELVNSYEKSGIVEIVNHQQKLNAQNDNNANTQHYDLSYRDQQPDEPTPPPPPPHQFDRWELELYSLAERTFSSLMQESAQNNQSNHDKVDTAYSDKEQTSTSRKSSSSMKNDIISVIKPSFTTINGDQVVDNYSIESDNIRSNSNSCGGGPDSLETRPSSKDHSSQSSVHLGNNNGFNSNNNEHSQSATNTDSPQSQEVLKQKLETQNVFSSPLRSRSGKDSILRTQSVRRNPAPEKLYDFIASDLVKRGYLVKHGALRSHNRWFVLKNFHLLSYKREAEETDKTSPSMSLKLEPSFQIQITSQSGDGYPFKLLYHDKSILLIADSPQTRDDWIGILTVAINMSDIEADKLTKSSSAHEGILSVTRHGHSKRCHAVLVNHVVFFLKSPIDPTPICYVSVKGAKIREVMDNYDYDLEEQENSKQKSSAVQDCSLAIYPRYSLNLDPVYLTLGRQQDTDEWFYHLSNASGIDQSSGTEFERVLTQIMVDNTAISRKNSSIFNGMLEMTRPGCRWREHSVMIYSDKPITQPLTSLPNETLRVEAVESFKSILLFTQVPLEPIAIDYHVCLLQNCFTRFLKYPELRNEFFAQLIKQSTYIKHSCYDGPKLSSSGSSGSTSMTHRSSFGSLSPSSSECIFITDLQTLDQLSNERELANKYDSSYSMSQQIGGSRSRIESSPQPEEMNPPTKGELLQVMQILAIAVSLNLPRGRLRWWLIYHLKKFANSETSIGKYASFTLQAIERTSANGCRDTVPSRTEIMSILLRNPFDHSTPHSLPVNFADGSYLVVGADGSTTIEEFMAMMGKNINIRPSPLSDFYLFADDPGDAKDLHILEPQRKVLDIVGWWEQTSKQSNSGRQHNTRVIKFICRKRLVLKFEEGETDQERLLIVNQVNQEIVSKKIPLNEALVAELGAIMTQLTYGDYKKSSQDPKMLRYVKEQILSNYMPHQSDSQSKGVLQQLIDNWQKLSGRTAQDCIRVYLNCIRRLKLDE